MDLVAIIMQLSDAGDNSDVRNKFLSRKNTKYEDESMASFECKICPALRNYHKAMVNAVAPFGEDLSFEKEFNVDRDTLMRTASCDRIQSGRALSARSSLLPPSPMIVPSPNARGVAGAIDSNMNTL